MSKKIVSLLLVLVMVIACFASCGLFGGNDNDDDDKNKVVYQDIDLADVVSREDYTSVYDMIGSKVTIDMVHSWMEK